jgi:hypothetical protein
MGTEINLKEDADLEEMIILKWVLKEYDGRVWTRSIAQDRDQW